MENQPQLNIEKNEEEHSFELWNKAFQEAESGNFSPEITKNENGEILAPNGEVSKLPNVEIVKVTRTPSFKSWFGHSKAIDDKTGEPTLVYHGTDADISTKVGLDPKQSKGVIKKLWFTSKRLNAVTYGELKRDSRFGSSFKEPVKPTVYSAFLNLKNPQIVDDFQGGGGMNPHIYIMWTQLKKLGKVDGIITKERGTYILFDAKNVMHLPSDIEADRSYQGRQ